MVGHGGKLTEELTKAEGRSLVSAVEKQVEAAKMRKKDI